MSKCSWYENTISCVCLLLFIYACEMKKNAIFEEIKRTGTGISIQYKNISALLFITNTCFLDANYHNPIHQYLVRGVVFVSLTWLYDRKPCSNSSIHSHVVIHVVVFTNEILFPCGGDTILPPRDLDQCVHCTMPWERAVAMAT